MRVVSGLEAIMLLHPTAHMRWASNKTLQIDVIHGEGCRERAAQRPDEHQPHQRGRRERRGSRSPVAYQEPLQAEARPLLVVRDPLGRAVGRSLPVVAAVDAVR